MNSVVHMGESTSIDILLPVSTFRVDRMSVIMLTKQRPPATNVEQWFHKAYACINCHNRHKKCNQQGRGQGGGHCAAGGGGPADHRRAIHMPSTPQRPLCPMCPGATTCTWLLVVAR